MLTKAFTSDHINVLARRLDTVLQQVMAGVLTPEEGTQMILRLGVPSP
jgi:hypothetical protein